MANPRTYLPDTNILVHMVRQGPLYVRVAAQYPISPTDPRPILNSIIVGEIRAFAKRNQWGQAKQQMIEDFVSRCIIIPLEEPGLVDAYVELEDYSHSIGKTMGDNDLWIAATTLVKGAVLLTTDRDFDHLSPGYILRGWIDPNTR